MSIETLVAFSNKYGRNPDYVLAGGGNTSMKDKTYLYIKGSGVSLADITASGFVKMKRSALAAIMTREYSAESDKREAEVLADLMASRMKGEEAKRPSVETLLHNLFPQKYVLHVHPAIVNGMTCSGDFEKIANELFPEAVLVPEVEPGYTLAKKCEEKLAEARAAGKEATLLFLQNHGVFFAADSRLELDRLASGVMKKLAAYVKRAPDFTPCDANRAEAAKIAPMIRMLYDKNGEARVTYTSNNEVMRLAESRDSFEVMLRPFTPDHIVYCKAEPLYVEEATLDALAAGFEDIRSRRGFLPKVVFVRGVGMFTVGKTKKEADTAAIVWLDAIKIAVYSECFGGASHMSEYMTDFIVNWEVESYRSKVSLAGGGAKALSGKIAIVTGSAQGFGAGIAEFLASEGASVVIADMNEAGAIATADRIRSEYKAETIACRVNVTDEASVAAMFENVVLAFGGLDVFVNNAGIVRAGGLEEMTVANFGLVTNVNYTAYFICTKYASAVMKLQRAASPEYMSDIIEINSKSGLSGSNKNFAYAGSKFGGLGLTQSFAMELAPFGIKVNAICPGNFLDGPLWSDPEKGLFVQYLNAGKVPGAKTVADVRRFYEAKVPLGRGCRTEDVNRAVKYIIEQKYETGQAVPVTGGQEMLK